MGRPAACPGVGDGLDSRLRGNDETDVVRLRGNDEMNVIPAKAGIQRRGVYPRDGPSLRLAWAWIPAFAGMTKPTSSAFAGMTR